MGSLTVRQRELAAQIIEERHCSLSKDSDPDYIEAAAFVFDAGVFFLGAQGMDDLAKTLRSQDEEER